MKNKLRIAALIIFLQSISWALTSGPSMPEYNDFESIENTDLVNLYSGSFTYSIPVMAVPGPSLSFPINLSYHSGIKPEQEASWVGLGWNLQSGAITRAINVLPDDFSGDVVEQFLTSKRIHGWSANASYSGVTVGATWDSENGLTGIVGLDLSVSAQVGDVGISGGMTRTIEFNRSGFEMHSTGQVSIGIGIAKAGLTINDRGGISTSFGVGVGGLSANVTSSPGNFQKQFTASTPFGVSVTSTMSSANGRSTTIAASGVGITLSKDGYSLGASIGPVGASFSSTASSNTLTNTGGFNFKIAGYGIDASWWEVIIDGFDQDYYYGYLYLDNSGMECVSGQERNCVNTDQFQYTPKTQTRKVRVKKMEVFQANKMITTQLKLGGASPDQYQVQTQGVSGPFRPYRTEDGDYYSYMTKTTLDEQVECSGFWGWAGYLCTREWDFDGTALVEAVRDLLNTPHSKAANLTWKFENDMGGGIYNNPLTAQTSGSNTTQFSKKIEPLYKNKKIEGFIITKADGVKYYYTQPQYNYIEETISGEDANLSKHTKQLKPTYAYAWLLTAILSPDYVNVPGVAHPNCQSFDNLSSFCLPADDDIGGWVRFEYDDGDANNKRRLYAWKTPYIGNSQVTVVDNRKVGKSYFRTRGIKSVQYLKSINTPTHEATFNLSNRLDSRGVSGADVTPIVFYPKKSNIIKSYPTQDIACNSSKKIRKYDLVISTNLPPGTKGELRVINDQLVSALGCKVLSNSFLWNSNYEINSAKQIIVHAWSLVENGTKEAHHFKIEYTPTTTPILKALTSIELRNKVFNKKISATKFNYDYLLAKNTPNGGKLPTAVDQRNGKLTLKGVQMGASLTGPFAPPYSFTYLKNPSFNPGEIVQVDKWGYFCQRCNSDQGKREPDGKADAWSLTKIDLPSKASLNVTYQPNYINWNIGPKANTSWYARPTVYAPSTTPTTSPDAGRAFNVSSYQPPTLKTYLTDKYLVYLGNLIYPIKSMKFDEDQRGETHFNLDLLKTNYPTNRIPDYFLFHFGETRTGNGLDGYPVIRFYSTGDQNKVKNWFPDAGNDRHGVLFASNDMPDRFIIAHQRGYDPIGGASSPDWNTRGKYNVWGVYSSDVQYYGPGIKVASVKTVDKITNKENALNYRYKESFITGFPASGNYLNYDFYRYRDGLWGSGNSYNHYPTTWSLEETGLSMYGGGLHAGNTYAEVDPIADNGYSLYQFFSPSIKPNQVYFKTITPATRIGDVKFVDNSTLWGLPIVKSDIAMVDGNLKRIRSEHYEYSQNWKVPELITEQSTFPNLESKLIFSDGANTNEHVIPVLNDDLNVVAHPTLESHKSYLGVNQSISSLRYVSGDCRFVRGDDVPDNCNFATGLTRTRSYKITPYPSGKVTVQDHVINQEKTNYFDYLTGSALVRQVINEGTDLRLTVSLPAYYYNSEFLSNNFLTQESSVNNFAIDISKLSDWVAPTPDSNFEGRFLKGLKFNQVGLSTFSIQVLNASNVGILDLRKNIVSAEYTNWAKYTTKKGSKQKYRVKETYSLDLTPTEVQSGGVVGFTFPTTGNPPGTRWKKLGSYSQYDDFGHPVEYIDAIGVVSSHLYGYNQGLITATISNGALAGALYESFETVFDVNKKCSFACASPIYFDLVNYESKTGKSALKVNNIGANNPNAVCLKMNPMYPNQNYTASVWYLDESVTNTKPGIWLGNLENANSCGNFKEAKTSGTGNWKRLEVSTTCSQIYPKADVCLYSGYNIASGNVLFDELRVHSYGSFMTTNAYDERGKIISSADKNEVVNHFDYDELGELVRIKQGDGLIVSEQAKINAND